MVFLHLLSPDDRTRMKEASCQQIHAKPTGAVRWYSQVHPSADAWQSHGGSPWEPEHAGTETRCEPRRNP